MTVKTEKTQIFLCHASEDKGEVLKVYKRLKDRGLKPWLDKKDLMPGQKWTKEIPKALKESHFVLIFFSKASVAKRGYVQKEFKLALDVLDEIPEGQIFIIPVRLDACQIPDEFNELHYVDLFEEDGFEQVARAIKAQQEIIESEILDTIQSEIQPGSQPLQEFSRADAENMLRERNFFDSMKNKKGKALKHGYKLVERQGEKLVIDHATGLTWQQSGSHGTMNYSRGHVYIKSLNKDGYASYDGWRLPTLEEAMSLMEPRNDRARYIDPIFDRMQLRIWTSNKESAFDAWAVSFDVGRCGVYPIDGGITFVRAVRLYRTVYNERWIDKDDFSSKKVNEDVDSLPNGARFEKLAEYFKDAINKLVVRIIFIIIAIIIALLLGKEFKLLEWLEKLK